MKKYQLAQKQGNDSIFTYYTFDNENTAEKPHIHICTNNEDWRGCISNNGLKTIATIELEQPYNYINIYDKKIKGSFYKTNILSWLTSLKKSWNGKVLDITNAKHALNDYFRSNNTNIHLF